jgi:hypothetical protein
MSLSSRVCGRIALLTGLTSISIVAGFAYLNGGLRVSPPIEDMGLSLELLVGYFVISILFQYGMPLLCIATLFFGFPAKNLLKAKIGIALAFLSLFCYIQFVRGCVQMIWYPS